MIKYLVKLLKGGFIMNYNMESSKKAEINMKFCEFEMPPMQDALLVGKKSPLGPESARRMVNILSPDQYEIIKIEHECIEAIVIRKSLINILPKETLVNLIMEEGGKIANEHMIIKAVINITLKVSKSIEL